MVDFSSKFTQKLILWGSDNVLKEYSTLLKEFQSSNNKPAHLMLVFEKLLYAIRSDVGHGNKGLGQRDLLTLFIKDINNYLRTSESDTQPKK